MLRIGTVTLTAYTLVMGVSILGKSPLDFYTEKIVKEEKKSFQQVSPDKKKYFIERSKELGYSKVNFDQWDLYLAPDDGFFCFGDENASISMIPFSWPLSTDRTQSIIETYKPYKNYFRNDTSIVEKITFNDLDNNVEIRNELIEQYGIVPITKDEEDANIEIINTTIEQHPSKDLTISNAKVFLLSFIPLVAVSKFIIPHKLPLSLVHLIIPYVAVELNTYTTDKEQNELIYRKVYSKSGAAPLLSYKRYLKAQMHLNKISKIYSYPSGDTFIYPWKTDKINTIDQILKENNISTTNFDDK